MGDIRKVTVAVLLSMFTLIFLMVFISDNATFYGLVPNTEFSNITDTVNQSYNSLIDDTTDIGKKVDDETGVASTTSEIFFTASAWSIVKIPFKIVGYMLTIMTQFAALFGIPKAVVYLLIGVSTVFIGYAILSVLFRSEI